MTGEITLRGRVLPVGGIKEKVLAAHRAGIRMVVLPEDNLADLGDVPADVRDAMQFCPVSTADEVLEAALLWDFSQRSPDPSASRASRRRERNPSSGIR